MHKNSLKIAALALALLFALSLLLAACANDKNGDADTAAAPEEEITRLITEYFDGINTGDSQKLKIGLPPSVPLTMGVDYDVYLNQLLQLEQEKVEAKAGKDGKVRCEVKSVSAVAEDAFEQNKQDVEGIYGLTDVTAIYEVEIERVYTDAAGAEGGRSQEVPLAVNTGNGWYVFME